MSGGGRAVALARVVTLPSLAERINAEHAAVGAALQSAVQHARRAGDLLLAAKEGVGHGGWLPWLSLNVPGIPPRTAQHYMNLARRWPELEAKYATVAHLTVREALALLTEPREPEAGAPAGGERTVPIDSVAPPALPLTDADDAEAAAKRQARLQAFGQVRPLIARRTGDGAYEAIEGASDLAAMRAAGFTQVRIHDRGALSDTDALVIALSFVFVGGDEVRYAAVAQAVHAAVTAGVTVEQLAAVMPFDAERIAYLDTLATFDWSVFAADAERERLIAAEMEAEAEHDHRCPRCNYEWNGKPRPFKAGGAAMHAARRRRERMAEGG